MENPSVLIVEDDPEQLRLLEGYLHESSMNFRAATNGAEALRAMADHPSDLLLTDLEMPGMDGMMLLESLQRTEQPPVPLLLTADSSPDTIVKSMKAGFFDFIPKPIQKAELFEKIRLATLESETRRMQRILQSTAPDQETSEWRTWQNYILIHQQVKRDQVFFNNMHQVMNQGAGLGVMLSTLELLKMTGRADRDRGTFTMDLDAIEHLFASGDIVQRCTEALGEIHILQNGKLDLETVTVRDVLGLLGSLKTEMHANLAVAGHKLVEGQSNNLNTGRKLTASLPHLERAIRELILNAIRFSPDGSNVFVLHGITGGRLTVSVLNPARQSQAGVDEWNDVIRFRMFEPFFRNINTVDERYDALDLGLGLTMVGGVIDQHGGEIAISRVRDHLAEHEQELVNITISIPLAT